MPPLSFSLRYPTGLVCLDPDLLEWPQRIPFGVEERIFQFRTASIQLTLDNLTGKYSDAALPTYIQGGEELLITDSVLGTLLWSGTVDPTDRQSDEADPLFQIRVLQTGSALNSVQAGKPDWLTDLPITNPVRRWRWTKKGPYWNRVADYQGTFIRTELGGDTDLFYTPSGYDLLTDPIEKFGYQKTRRYDSYRGLPGGIEPPLTLLDPSFIPHVPFVPYYHPDFTANPGLWRDTEPIRDSGAFIANPDDLVRPSLLAVNLQTIIADLVQQHNEQYPATPLNYIADPADLQPPVLDVSFQLLNTGRGIRAIDLYPATSGAQTRLYLLVSWSRLYPDGTEDTRHSDFSLYEVQNGSVLIPLYEWNFPHPGWDPAWPDFPGALRFARAQANPAGFVFFYILRTVVTPPPDPQRAFEWRAARVSIADNQVQPFTFFNTHDIIDDEEANRSVDFSANWPGTLADPPEIVPLQDVTYQGIHYRILNNRVIVSGSPFLRQVAFDYEDTSLARILTDLAIISDSVFFVTPDRQLIFRSRALWNTSINVLVGWVNRDLKSVRRTLADEEIPALNLGIKISDEHKIALQNYYRDTRFPREVQETTLFVERGYLATLPRPGDRVNVNHDDLNFGPDPLVTELAFVGDFELEIHTRSSPLP